MERIKFDRFERLSEEVATLQWLIIIITNFEGF